KMNFEFMTYSTPNTKVRDLLTDPALKDSDILFPSEEDLKDCELLHYLGKDATDLYNKFWRDIKSK
ncbi:MAG: spermidine/putrescine ABC transporter permease/substrate-binding protein PotCD, partial [Lachnospiraceae bacterium]|nr:spermidine/putrescine ABC transporter permease/substrate-binding protein PotCD [Lachnospiraceae bacterium]